MIVFTDKAGFLGTLHVELTVPFNSIPGTFPWQVLGQQLS